MADFNVAWKQRIQLGFLFEYVQVQSLSHSIRMEGGHKRCWSSWKSLKQRLGWKQNNLLGFCGSSKWVPNTDAMEDPLLILGDQSPIMSDPRGSCIDQILAGNVTTINLATALAADRQQVNVGSVDWMKVKPLKSMFEEIDSRDVKVAHEDDGGRGGNIGTVCCLCTERNKGVVLIPCAHTYCRVCSRSMWSKQEACPLCNRLIMDILEIF